MTSLERALVRVLLWLGAGLGVALPLLLVPQTDHYLAASTIHLSAVVALGLGATFALYPCADGSWFSGSRLSPLQRSLASAVGIIVLVTGMIGLVTLATAAALRFQPSLQFLQLLSALDIAWAGAAIIIGAYRGWGRRVAVVAGMALGAACVWSIWRYLETVGFTGDGGWLLDGGKLMTIVIPADMIAAAIAATVLVVGTRRSQATEQPSPQS
jgi:hypothetical protein